jgi:asparagine synthase (glutamine-hydrolysing)
MAKLRSGSRYIYDWMEIKAMCGILGSVGVNGFVDKDVRLLAHRGPDGNGFFRSDSLFLGHTRLAIQDTTDAAVQPMTSGCGRFALTYNGEIYNHVKLRSEWLADIEFKSTGDTETLLWGLVRYGVDFLKEVNGMFAFGFFDHEKQTLLIARDPVGIKPLYYATGKGQFAFASELKALRALAWVDLSPDPDALAAYLQLLYAPGELTPVRGIRKLEPGHAATIRFNNSPATAPDIKRYIDQPWRAEGTRKRRDVDLEAILLAAVERQLLSDRPVGFFLSGGIDSSLVVAMARKIVGPTPPLHCFTARSPELEIEGFQSDLPYAQIVAQHLGAHLHEVDISPPTFGDVAEMVRILDEPQADFAPLVVREIARVANSMGIPVLMSGAGGDDIFTGYRRHVLGGGRVGTVATNIPICRLLRLAAKIVPSRPASRRLARLATMLGEVKRYPTAGWFAWISSDEAIDLARQLLPGISPNKPLESLEIKAAACGLLHPLDRMLVIEAAGFLPDHNLNYTDKMGMVEGVEIRVPYLDRDVVASAWSMQRSALISGKKTKLELRKVAPVQ